MKKIGILTFHYADNYGAILQAYALRKAIISLGFQADIINYVPSGYKIYPYENSLEGIKKIGYKREQESKFFINYCNVTSPYSNNVDWYKFDCICFGSDQIWNADLCENIDLFYFGRYKPDDVRSFTYAASIGTPISKIDKKIFEKYINRFDRVSIREGNEYLNFIEKIYSKGNVVQCLDPTLLLSKDDYEKIATKSLLIKKHPFIFLFWLGDKNINKGIDFSNKVSAKYGLHTIHTVIDAKSYYFFADDGCMYYGGIEDFLWCITNAECVVTNSFHGFALSIALETPFYLFYREYQSRMFDLMNLTGTLDRCAERYISPSDISLNIDFKEIEQKLSSSRLKSFNYLVEALNECTM